MKRTELLAVGLAGLASIVSSRTAEGFDSKGHDVIEALAYRTLVEGHADQPRAPEVLRDLFNDGALVRPICFGGAASQTNACRTASVDNPLLEWPEPRTDRPDAAFRRQFSDPGQCYHFMATLADEATAPLDGGPTPRALATTAVIRCRDLLDELLRQIVVVGGATTRDSGRGLYELMHSVADSFSYAHAQRTATHAIAFLRTWEPIAKLAGGRLRCGLLDVTDAPRVSRPARPGVRTQLRGGRRAAVQGSDGLSLRRTVRLPLGRGGSGAPGARGAPRRGASPSRRPARRRLADRHPARAVGTSGEPTRTSGFCRRRRARGRSARHASQSRACPATTSCSACRPRTTQRATSTGRPFEGCFSSTRGT